VLFRLLLQTFNAKFHRNLFNNCGDETWRHLEQFLFIQLVKKFRALCCPVNRPIKSQDFYSSPISSYFCVLAMLISVWRMHPDASLPPDKRTTWWSMLLNNTCSIDLATWVASNVKLPWDRVIILHHVVIFVISLELGESFLCLLFTVYRLNAWWEVSVSSLPRFI
jgi:hypothetical protein